MKPEIGSRSKDQQAATVHVHVRVRHSEEVKAAAMAELLRGQSVNEVARKYQIPPGTASAWRAKARAESGITPNTPAAVTIQKETIADLLLEYMKESIISLRAQVKAFSDPEWLRSQSAADLAILHGVQNDKMVRMLEALGGPEEQENGE